MHCVVFMAITLSAQQHLERRTGPADPPWPRYCSRFRNMNNELYSLSQEMKKAHQTGFNMITCCPNMAGYL